MKNLISMTDFVLEKNKAEEVTRQSYIECRNYANFLKQILEIWMFVPAKLVNGEWLVLEEPNIPFQDSIMEESVHLKYANKLKEYQEAKQRCIFSICEIKEEKFIHNTKHYFVVCDSLKIFWNFNGKWEINKGFKTIEGLVKYNLKLTDSAIKQIGL